MDLTQIEIDRLEASYLPEPNSGCWLWVGYIAVNGYGRFNVTRDGIRKRFPAHRVLYEYKRAPIPSGLQLDHLCRVHSCVNPDHLEPVTPGENVRRGMSPQRQRSKTHCPYGHPYSPDNTYLRGPRRWRTCVTCSKRMKLEYRIKKLSRQQ